jgi:xanthine/uracil permease
MDNRQASTRALVNATLLGTLLQVAMVVAGHYNAGIANLFAVMGMTISFVAGLVYAMMARRATKGSSALGGAIAGGVCALIGILVSFLLGDVPATLLALGTLSSVVTGAVGGLVGHVVPRSPARA